jgi:hypothetical protein
MSDESRADDASSRAIVLRLHGMDDVAVVRDVAYAEDGGQPLTMDVYRPQAASDGPFPGVVIAAGFPDEGFEKVVGCSFKRLGAVTSWARLLAASGIAAIAYANREPARDLGRVLEHVRSAGEQLGIDATRVGLFASSGNGPVAVSALSDPRFDNIRCAALCYPYTLDLDGTTAVADAAATFRFANPASARGVDDLRPDLRLMLVRAGLDAFTGLNDALDRFVAHALRQNLDLTLVNYARAPHAFDVALDTDESRQIIAQVVAFLASALGRFT